MSFDSTDFVIIENHFSLENGPNLSPSDETTDEKTETELKKKLSKPDNEVKTCPDCLSYKKMSQAQNEFALFIINSKAKEKKENREAEIYGSYVAEKLKNMNRTSRIEVQRDIMELLNDDAEDEMDPDNDIVTKKEIFIFFILFILASVSIALFAAALKKS